MLRYRGYLVIGDVHSDYSSLLRAEKFALSLKLQIIQLGDLVDYGSQPIEVVELMLDLVKQGRARIVRGNHDLRVHNALTWKFDETSEEPLAAARKEFLDLYRYMETYIAINKTYFTHAAFDSSFWTGNRSNKVQETFLYGQVNKDLPKVQFANNWYYRRVYDWCNSVPLGKTAIVGHDRSPMMSEPSYDANINEVFVYKNPHNGKVIFTDTGAGKGGHLSGAILDTSGQHIDQVSFT